MPEDFMSGAASTVDADMKLFTDEQVDVMRGFLFKDRGDTFK